MYYIGIDLGTSAVKLLLMDETGSIANIVSREYPIAFPHPGWSEQDPADWWAAVCDGIPALLDGFDASQVKGIGAGGQMHGLVVLDKNDTVIRPCILWNDGRTQRLVDYSNGVIGKDKLSRYPQTSPLQASPHPNCFGCGRTSRTTSPASKKSCCRRITSTIS